jgi:ABC-type glycerol-3-phosphate transport system substrate-binding protein
LASESRRGRNTQRRPALRALVGFLCTALLATAAGCQAPAAPVESVTAIISPSSTPATNVTPRPTQPAPTPTVDATRPLTVTLWVPPDLAATARVDDGLLAQAQRRVTSSSPDARFVVLTKAMDGAGGIPALLAAMHPVLPDALPDVALVDTADIPALAGKGLLVPLDGLLSDRSFEGLYPFARSAVQVDGAFYGFPLDAHLTAMFYNTGMLGEPPEDWDELLTIEDGYLAPLRVGDGAMFRLLLSHYRALGGAWQNSDGQPMLDATVAARVLRGYLEVQRSGVVPEGGLSLDSADACWAVYLTGEAAICSSTSYQYLRDRERLRFTKYAQQASFGGPAPAVGSSRAWVLVTDDPARQELAAQLITQCAMPARTADWLRASYQLPTTRAPLSLLIEDEQERAHWDQELEAAIAAPDAELRDRLQPVLERALEDVLNGSTTPEQAAVTAALALESAP